MGSAVDEIKMVAMFEKRSARSVKSMSSGRVDLRRSWVGLEWALPGVVVSIVVPFSVSVGNALELLISNVVVGVGVWSLSVDTLLTGDSLGWSVHGDGSGHSNKSGVDKLHF